MKAFGGKNTYLVNGQAVEVAGDVGLSDSGFRWAVQVGVKLANWWKDLQKITYYKIFLVRRDLNTHSMKNYSVRTPDTLIIFPFKELENHLNNLNIDRVDTG